jgi:hypothetical protein|tara:strand:- start:100 stop:348 length:249 start_codon:yes stop_codon:yes gene_type:complete
MSLIKKEPIDFISKDQQFVADFYRAERRKLLTHLICTFDKSPEANVDDYSTDMGALRHLVDRMLNHGQTFDTALVGTKFYHK